MGTTYVAICGSGAPEHSDLLDQGRVAGRLCAERGWVVLTGGLGGVMAAAADGVTEAGGTAIALLPGVDRQSASAGHSIVLPTGMGEMRNVLLVRCADAVLAIGGSWGTLSEIALAARTGVPVVTVGTDLPVFAGPEVGVATDARPAVSWLAERLPGDDEGRG